MAYQQVPQQPQQPQQSPPQFVQRAVVPARPQMVGVPVPVYAQPPDGRRQEQPKQFTYVQTHIHPVQHRIAVVESKPPQDNCPSWWICFGLFGFVFILLLLGISTTGDCVSSDNWLFCDNHLHTHHDDDNNHDHGWGLLLIGIIAIGGIAACWWFSGRRKN